MQNRFKSKALWISTATLIFFVLKTYFDIEIPKSDELVNLILIVATGFGIINNPQNKDGI